MIRSYRLVFRRRWRIYRIQNWRIPLPGGLELRLIGYWLASLAAVAALARLPILGAPLTGAPPAFRLLALPILCAWTLSRSELDGRAPHRALLGLARWRLRPRVVAAGRAVPRPGSSLAPLEELILAPDLGGPRYPRGELGGPVRVLLRYPVEARKRGRTLHLRQRPGPALHKGRLLELTAGQRTRFEPER